MAMLPNAHSKNQVGYVTWNDPQNFVKASEEYGRGVSQSQPMMRSSAAIANRFQNIDSNTSVRDTFSRLDYDFFRPNEQVPKHFRDIIAAAMGGYQKVPVVRQVIDLMGDFTMGGIKLVHEDPEIQNFYNVWFNKINGAERSERICNCLYRAGNVIIKRANALLADEVVTEWKKTIAQEVDLEHEDDYEVNKNEIPYRYTIINPLIVEVLGEHMAAFTGKVHYVLKLPSTFYNTLSLPLTSYDPSILTEGLPRDLQQAMDRNEKYLLLDSEKLITLFYKKDDWDVWAYPMLYSLLDEIILLQKMKMADMTALDGVISHIRIWKLGSLEHKIFPTDAAISKLSNILLNHMAGGAMDFIWGPDLELTETSTDIMKFLGSEKYAFVMNTIHGGLGIPAAIGQSRGDMTSNFMSLRVLMERLQYGRRVLTRFWDNEIEIVRKAMGFKKPAYCYYDNITLHDEVAEKALWIQLVDRDLIPVEAVQERFGRIPEIDNILIKREYAQRERGNIAVKVSPYHDSQPDLSLMKIGMQRGMITPSEAGIELEEPTPEHKEMLENTFPDPIEVKKAGPPQKKPVGVSGQGRPGGSRDKNKRKQRIPKPSSKASTESDWMINYLYAGKLQKAINEHINPYFLEKFNHKNLREFTESEGIEMEKFKFRLLYKIPTGYTSIGETVIKDALGYPGESEEFYNEIEESYKKVAEAAREKKTSELTFDELSNIKNYIYAMINTSENSYDLEE